MVPTSIITKYWAVPTTIITKCAQSNLVRIRINDFSSLVIQTSEFLTKFEKDLEFVLVKVKVSAPWYNAQVNVSPSPEDRDPLILNEFKLLRPVVPSVLLGIKVHGVDHQQPLARILGF